VSRVRFTTEYSGVGNMVDYLGNPIASQNNLSKYRKVTDETMTGDGWNFDTRHVTSLGGIIKTLVTSGTTGAKWTNWQASRLANPNDSLYAHLAIPGRPSNAFLATDTVKKTNPSRPVVDLSVSVAELRELPKLIQKEGDSLIRKWGKQTLNREFGWIPLVKDLRKLATIRDDVVKRLDEIRRLKSEGGLRRSVDLWAGSVSGSYDVITQSGYKLVVHHYLDYTTQTKLRGFVVWTPDELGETEGRSLLKTIDAVLGLKLDMSTLWNLMPWSWMIDWFTNIGDILEGSRNIIGATHGQVQLMDHSITTIQGLSNYPGAITPFSGTLETKQRRRHTGSIIDVQLPLLTQRQITILGAIAVTRRRPG